MRPLLVLLIIVVACGDNLSPTDDDAGHTAAPDAFHPDRWGDAWNVYADAWCTAAERCIPPERLTAIFGVLAGTHDGCRRTIMGIDCWSNAEGSDWCERYYPVGRDAVLQQCHADVGVIACDDPNQPRSCGIAFQGFEID